ncbi:hypothetical protein [Natronospora cellulosivora (SeqCode)]
MKVYSFWKKYLEKKLEEVKEKDSHLAEIESKLKRMKALAEQVRDDDPEHEELKEIQRKFDLLKEEVVALDKEIELNITEMK